MTVTAKMLRKAKLGTAILSAGLLGSAFQTGGCTINIDQELLNQLSGLVGEFTQRPGVGPHFGGPGHHEPNGDFDDSFDLELE